MHKRRPPAASRKAALILFLAAAVSSTAAASATQAPSGERRGSVVLVNGAFDSVRVEVRAGDTNDCEASVRIGVITLRRDGAWRVATPRTICWRREEVPGSGIDLWTNWRHARVPATGQAERSIH